MVKLHKAQMDPGARLAREMQDRVNDGRLRELEGLRRRMAHVADDDDYYSDEKMKERFRQEPPDEFVCGVALPKTNGVRWWTPAGCPPWLELIFMGVQWFQTMSIFAYPVFLYRSFGLVPLLLRIWLIVPLGQHLEYSFMDSGANKGTAFGTVQCLYVASYLFAATVDRDDWPVLGYCLLFVMYLWAVGFGTCLLEASIGRSLWAACAVYTQLLCSIVRRVRDRTWPGILTGRYALLALVLLGTWIALGYLGHALEAREKEKKSRWDRDERGRELRKRLAQLLGVTEEDLDEIAKPGDGASAEVVAKRLGERLRMGNEDRRARADAEQRVKDAGREIHKELAKLNAQVAAARREASEARQGVVELGGRRFAVEGPGGAEGLNTFLRNAEEFNKASEAKAAAAANAPRDVRDARELRVGRELAAHLFRTDPETMRRLRRRHEDDEPTDTEPKPRVAPGAVPVTTVRGPDGSMRVKGARVLFHGANNDASPSESSEETASDDSGDDEDDEGIRPWDPD